MKTIGLLGGTSWPSTIEYYRILNQLAQERLGGFHSASLLLRSIDFHEIKSRFHSGWNEIPLLLKKEIERFVKLEPDCLLICNNTLHKAYDLIESELNISIPVFHIVDATGRYAKANKLERLLLLGTKFTMEDGFYQRRLEKKFRLSIEVPQLEERLRIQKIQSQLARGLMKQEYRDYFLSLINRYPVIDAVVLACSELPLAINQGDFDVAIVNPSEQQCREAFEYAAPPPPA